MKKTILISVVGFLFLAAFAGEALAQEAVGVSTTSTLPPMIGGDTRNPSAVYCQNLGYKFEVVKTPQGEDGVCNVAGGKAIPSWDFVQGKEGAEYSYCNQKGYKYKLVKDREKCGKYFSGECLLCVLDDGVEVEASDLMNIQNKGLPLPTTTSTMPKPTTTQPVKPASSCGNGVCESSESAESCPADCKANASPILYVALAVIVLLIAAYALLSGKLKKGGQ